MSYLESVAAEDRDRFAKSHLNGWSLDFAAADLSPSIWMGAESCEANLDRSTRLMPP